jgi:hypothetical protein
MSLADRLATSPPKRGYPSPLIDELLEKLDPAESDALRSMLANPAWSHEAIASALVDEGWSITGQTVGRYRKLHMQRQEATP